jgi:hypothetical protein
MRSQTIFAMLLLFPSLATSRAEGASSPPPLAGTESADRVGIGSFQGPQAGRIQGALETGLLARYYVVPDFKVLAEAKRQGVELRDDRGFRLVGRALAVRAFVSADVRRRAGWQVALMVRRGDTGAPIGRILLADRRLDRLESVLATRASDRLGSLLARAPDQASPPEVDPPIAAAAAAPPESAAPAQPIWELAAGARMFSRSFSYAQNLSGLPGYQLGRAFATTLQAAVRPGALLAPRWRPWVVSGGLEYGLAIETRSDGTEGRTSTRATGYHAALGYTLGEAALVVTPQLAYGVQTFTTGADPAAAAPDVRYRMLGLGVDGRWMPARALALVGRAAYLHALSLGRLADTARFPHATASGLELEATAAFVLLPTLELRASLGLRRLGLAMNSVPGDRWVAGGAVDQSSWAGLSLAWRR